MNNIRKSRKLRQSYKLDSSLRLLIDYLEKNPNDCEGRIELAKTYIAKNEYNKAIDQCEYVLDKCENISEAHGTLAYLYLQQGNYEKCASEVTDALDNNQNYAMGHGILGKMYHEQKMIKKARINLEKAKEIAPNNYLIRYWLGVLYSDLSKYTLAAREYITFFRLRPSPENLIRVIIGFGQTKPKLFKVSTTFLYFIVFLINSWYVLPIVIYLLYLGYISYIFFKREKIDNPALLLYFSLFVAIVYFYRLLVGFR